MRKLARFLWVIPMLTSSAALADTIGPFTTTTPIPSTLTDWTGSLSFPKFDSSLGTLTSVQLNLSGSFDTVLTVTNASPEGSSGWAKTELQVTVQDEGHNLITPELDLYSPAFDYTLGPGDDLTSGTLSKSGTSSDLYTSAEVLSEFTGPGTISLSASTFTQTLLSNTGGNTSASQVTNASLTGSVIYTYIVPEPISAGLLGFGAIALLARRRAR